MRNLTLMAAMAVIALSNAPALAGDGAAGKAKFQPARPEGRRS